MAVFWMIEESVGRYYILLEDIYASREEASREIERLGGHDVMRAVLYETGKYDGPRRVLSTE